MTQEAVTQETVTIDVTVWRSVRFPERYYVSTRPEGGGWTTHDTIIDLTTLHSSGRFHQGSPVPVEVELAGHEIGGQPV